MDKYYFYDRKNYNVYTSNDEKRTRVRVNAELYDKMLANCPKGHIVYVSALSRLTYLSCERAALSQKVMRLREVRQLLTSTDYIVTKLAEMQLSEDVNYSAECARYKETVENRKEWRAEANRLLGEIEVLQDSIANTPQTPTVVTSEENTVVVAENTAVDEYEVLVDGESIGTVGSDKGE